MAVASEYVAEISVDLEKLEAGVRAAREKLSKIGDGIRPDSIDKPIASIGARLKTLGDSAQKAGLAMSVGLTLPLLGVAKKIFDVGDEYQKAMNVFQAATSATATEMARAAAMAEQLGADMSLPATSAGNAAQAMTELAKGGFTAAQAMDAAKGTLQLAAAATISEAQAAEIAANAINAFGLAASDAGRVADLLAASANASSAEITDVALSMQQSAASAFALKIPIEDLVTSIGLMANAGIKGSDAGTSLKTMFAALTPKTNEAAMAMKDLGIDAFDAQGKFVGLEAVIAQAQPALKRMTDEQKAYAIEAAFGSDAMRAANILLGQGVEKFHAMEGAVTRAGAAQDFAAAKTKGLGGALGGLVSQLETIGLQIFKTVAPALEGMVRSLADATAGFSNLNPKVLQAGVTLGALAASGGPLLLITSQLLKINPILATMAVAIGVTAFSFQQNLGQMGDSVTRFAGVFGTSINSTKSPLDIFVTALDVAVLSWSTFSSSILTSLDVLITRLKSWAIAAGKALILDFSGAVAAIEEGDARIGASMDAAARDRAQQQKEWQALFRGGWREHYAELERMAGLGAIAAGNEFSSQFKFSVNQGNPGLSLQEALQKYRGPTIEAARALGLASGKAALESWRIGIDQKSPSGFEKDLARIEKAFIAFPDTISKLVAPKLKKASEQMLESFQAFTAGVNRFLSSAVKNVQVTEHEITRFSAEWRKRITEVVRDSEKAAEEMRQIGLTIAFFPEKARAAFDALIVKAKEASQIITVSSHEISSAIKSTLDLPQVQVDAMTAATEYLILDREIRQKLSDENVRRAQEENRAIIKAYEDMVDRLKSSVGPGIAGIIGAFSDGFNKIKLGTLQKITETSEGILQVIGNLPGKIGDKLRGATNVFLQWVDRIDGILRGLHKIFKQVPDGLGGMIESIVGIFKSKQQKVEEALDSVLGPVQGKAGEAGGKSGESFASGFLGKLGLIASGIATFMGSRGQGKLAGMLGGAAAGAQIGTAILPGIGTAIGAGVGFFAGLFGSGKSAAQKEAERQQAESLKRQIELEKQAVLKGAQEVVQAALDTFIKAREALEAISAHFRIPKEVFRLFFRDLDRLLTEFIKLSKKFGGDLLQKASQFAEFLSPGVDLISKAPLALEAIGKYLGVTEAAIVRFFSDFSRIVDHLGVLAESVPAKLQKHVKKFAARVGEAVGLVSDVAGGLKSLFEVKPLDVGSFDYFGLALEAIINKIGDIAERFDKYYIKQIGLFSERVAPGIALVAGTVQAIKDSLEVPRLNPATLEGIFTDLTAIVHRAIDFTKAIPSDVLSLVSETAQRVIPIINVIQSMAEAFKAVSEYKPVKDAFQTLLRDFTEAIGMMRFLEDLSVQFKDKALFIQDNLLMAVDAMTNAISKFGNGLAALNGVMQGGLSSFTFPNSEADFGSLSFAGAGGSNFSALAPAPSPVVAPAAFGRPAPSAPGPTIINKYFIVQPGGVQIAADTIEKLEHAIEISEEVAEELSQVGIRVMTQNGS